jgi:uncharacterized Rossmann fold enzyme
VKYEDWEPVYQEICEYFSFDPVQDEQAAQVAASLSKSNSIDILIQTITGKPVTVCGNAPCLKEELDKISGVIIAADAASAVLLRSGIRADIIVTDLDGIDDYATRLNESGTIMVVHAHGDNIPRLKTWIPRLPGPMVLTTQGRPFDHVHNFGGFSDGDRAAYMAQECGASSVTLIGFDCDDPSVSPIKQGKLIWARRLLADIGYEC